MRENDFDPRRSSDSGNEPVPDVFLERYLLGELPDSEKSAIEARLFVDQTLRTRLDLLKSDDNQYARTHDAGLLAHAVRERLRRESLEADLRRTATISPRSASGNIPGFAGWKPLLGGALVLALVAAPAWRVLNGERTSIVRSEIPEPIGADETGVAETPLPGATHAKSAPEIMPGGGTENAGTTDNTGNKTPSATSNAPDTDAETPADRIAGQSRGEEPSDEDVTRLKGFEPGLALFRRTKDGAEPLKPGAVVKPGDVVRIGYRAGGLTYGAIFSVDGNGNVTRHWPISGDRAVRLGKGETLLPGAFELDAAPDYERFYLLTAEKVFDLKPVLEALHDDKSPARNDVTVVRFDLIKENGI